MNIRKDFADEIIGKLANNPAVDRAETLPFDVATFQKVFNEQVKLYFASAEDFARPVLRKFLTFDKYQIFADDETALFVKIFNDVAGLFGFGASGGNFKILSLCYIITEDGDARAVLDLVFNAFVKTFLPNLPINEFIAAMVSNNFLTTAGVTFESVTSGELNMLNVFVEPKEVFT